jgi:hypothetical protein
MNLPNGPGYETDLPDDLEKPVLYDAGLNLPVFTAGNDYRLALKKLEQGGGLIVEGSYSTAIAFYSWLKKQVTLKYPVTGYLSSRKSKEILFEKTNRILIRVTAHSPELARAPEIRWLKSFYPGTPDFLISLPDFLGMNGAWQWHIKGVNYKDVGIVLHPFYGVYFPTRSGHLELFDRWFINNGEEFGFAADIGTGSGILSFIMARHGIGKIHATDINPNAVYSATKDASRLNLSDIIHFEQQSFFGSLREVSGLTVFNPPWIPGRQMNVIDRGIYYEPGFFENFFQQAAAVISPGSVLAIIFSSFAIEAGITGNHPVEEELLNRNFVLKEKITGEVAERTATRSKDWLNEIRKKEKTELWILGRV